MFSCFMPCFLCLDLLFPMFFGRSTCFHVSYHVFVPRSIFLMCCLARSTCFYACLHVYLSFLHALCFIPCLDSSFLCINVWIYILTCLISCLCAKLLHVYMHISMPICLYLCLHMLVRLDLHSSMLLCCIHMLRCTFTCLHAYRHAYTLIYAFICLCA